MNRRFVFILIMIVPAFVSAFLNEPDGFRAARWWSKVPSGWARTTAPLDQETDVTSVTFWRNPQDEMRIGDARVNEIIYLAWEGQICAVHISFDYGSNEAIKKAFLQEYGTPQVEYGGRKIILLWKGPKTCIDLQYVPSHPGTLYFEATDLNEKRSEKARSTAKTPGS